MIRFILALKFPPSVAALLKGSRGCSRRVADPQAADLPFRWCPWSGLGPSVMSLPTVSAERMGLPSPIWGRCAGKCEVADLPRDLPMNPFERSPRWPVCKRFVIPSSLAARLATTPVQSHALLHFCGGGEALVCWSGFVIISCSLDLQMNFKRIFQKPVLN